MFDIDNLGDDSKAVVHVPTAVVTDRTFDDAFDAATRKLYVIDKSSSMAAGLIGLADVSAFNFTPSILAKARKRIENAQERLSPVLLGAAPATPSLVLSKEDPANDPRWFGLADANDERLKAEIVANGLTVELGLQSTSYASWDYSGKNSKLSGVKRFLRQVVEERYKKYPDALVQVVAFDGGTYTATPDSEQELLEQIDSLEADGGDTDIMGALRDAIAICDGDTKAAANHIILVTDALDEEASDCGSLLPQMTRLGISLDFLHVCSLHESVSDEASWTQIRDLCLATGGRYTRIDRAAAFRDTFVEAARRTLLLNAAAPKQVK